MTIVRTPTLSLALTLAAGCLPSATPPPSSDAYTPPRHVVRVYPPAPPEPGPDERRSQPRLRYEPRLVRVPPYPEPRPRQEVSAHDDEPAWPDEVGCWSPHIGVVPGDEVVPGTVLQLIGEQPGPNPGVPLTEWFWSVKAPDGSAAQLEPSAASANPTFLADVPGLYTFTLDARDASGTGGLTLGTLQVVAIPDMAIALQVVPPAAHVGVSPKLNLKTPWPGAYTLTLFNPTTQPLEPRLLVFVYGTPVFESDEVPLAPNQAHATATLQWPSGEVTAAPVSD